jgi:hypothetical protein
MPAEAERLTRAFGRRDRLVIVVVALGTVLAAGSALAITEFSSNAQLGSEAGCIRIAEAGVLGGGAWHLCGAAAAHFCRARATQTPSLQRQCTRLTKKN